MMQNERLSAQVLHLCIFILCTFYFIYLFCNHDRQKYYMQPRFNIITIRTNAFQIIDNTFHVPETHALATEPSETPKKKCKATLFYMSALNMNGLSDRLQCAGN